VKRILFVIPTLGSGGAERVITNLVNNISRKKFQPEVLVVKKGRHDYLEAIKEDVKIFHLDYEGRIRYSIIKVLREVNKISPDTVFMGMGDLNVLISVFLPFNRKFKWIARETNMVSVRASGKFTLFLYRKFYKNYDKIIAQCKDMQQDLLSLLKIPADKVEVINNPIDTNYIDSRLYNESNVIKKDSRLKYIVACGRLTYQKGFDMLIDQFSKLDNVDRFNLIIIGESNSLDRNNNEYLLKNKVKELGLDNLITFIPFQENIYRWLYEADIFVLSSRFEGFPNVLLEAIYCGTPALANDCKGGIREIIIDSVNGFVFNFEKNEFEKKLEKLMTLQWNRKEISNTIRNRYNVDIILEKYNRVL